MTGVVHRGFVLRRTWDCFEVAWPFSRVDVVLGQPVDPGASADPRDELESALVDLNVSRPLSSKESPSARLERDRVDLDPGAARQGCHLDRHA